MFFFFFEGVEGLGYWRIVLLYVWSALKCPNRDNIRENWTWYKYIYCLIKCCWVILSAIASDLHVYMSELSILQSSMSHDPFEIYMLFWCSRNMSYYYQCWKQLCCLICLEKQWCILLRILNLKVLFNWYTKHYICFTGDQSIVSLRY